MSGGEGRQFRDHRRPAKRPPPHPPPPPQVWPPLPRSQPPAPLLEPAAELPPKPLPQLFDPQDEPAERASPAARADSEDWRDWVALLFTEDQLPLLYCCQPLPVFR